MPRRDSHARGRRLELQASAQARHAPAPAQAAHARRLEGWHEGAQA
ncbi:hypothetical protein ACRBEV_29635 [Methylobacterium phyllosphaerae]